MESSPEDDVPKNNTRLVLFTDDPGEGGVAIYVHALACGLARRSYTMTVVQSQSGNPMIDERKTLGVCHYWLPFNTRENFLRTMTNEADVEEAYLATRPDLILFANCDPFSNLAAKNMAVKKGIPFVIVENYVWSAARLSDELARFLPALKDHYQRARAVVAVSQNNLELLQQGFGLPSNKGQVVHYGRPDYFFTEPGEQTRSRLRRDWKIPEDAVLCLTVGRLERIKGYQLLLAMLNRLVHESIWPRLYFAWLGAGSLELALKGKLKDSGLEDQVRMLGHRWDVADWLDTSDLFILPSYCEGMPLSILEAMAKGVPVMATAISGNPEALGETGKLLPSPVGGAEATIREMAATLLSWASDSRQRTAIGAGCKARASAMFREERMLAETRQILDRAMLP
jgi:glycosyltransferase involved in cell wall biosynthesis